MPIRRSQRNTTVQLSWEEQRRLEGQRFIEGWDWKRVFRDWTERIGDFAVAVSPFFTEVYVRDPHNPVGREPCLSWWPSLVWTTPTTKIAEDFGVSDVAIGKQCKSLGINKRPPGFWAKVDAGVIPHPNGQLPRD